MHLNRFSIKNAFGMVVGTSHVLISIIYFCFECMAVCFGSRLRASYIYTSWSWENLQGSYPHTSLHTYIFTYLHSHLNRYLLTKQLNYLATCKYACDPRGHDLDPRRRDLDPRRRGLDPCRRGLAPRRRDLDPHRRGLSTHTCSAPTYMLTYRLLTDMIAQLCNYLLTYLPLNLPDVPTYLVPTCIPLNCLFTYLQPCLHQ